MEKIGSDLQLSELKRNNLYRAYEQTQAHASSVLLFTLQWKDLEEHLDSTRKSLQKGFEEVLSRDKQVEEARREVEERARHVGLKEKTVEDLGERVSKISTEIEMKETQLGSVQKWLEECSGELNSKERELDCVRKSIKSEEEQLGSVRRLLEECSREIELKQEQLCLVEESLLEQSGELGLKEQQLGKVQNMLEQCSKELNLKEDQVGRVEEFLVELSLKEDQVGGAEELLQVRSKELTSKEDELGRVQNLLREVTRDLNLKEKQVGTLQKLLDELSVELSLKDEQLVQVQKLHEERSKEVALQQKLLEDLSQEVDMEKRALDTIQIMTEKKSMELQSKEKEIDSIKASIQEYNEKLEVKQKEHDNIQKSIEECSKKCRSKHQEYELFKKSVEDSCAEVRSRQLGLIEEMTKKYYEDIELKQRALDAIKRSIEERAEELESKDKQLKSIEISIEELDKELTQKKGRYNSIQKSTEDCSAGYRLKEEHECEYLIRKSVEKLCAELRLQEKERELVKKSLKATSAELRSELKEQDLKFIESLEESWAQIKRKEQKLESIEKDLQLRSKELELKENNFDSIIKSIEERSGTLDTKERQFEERVKEFKLKEAQFELIQKLVEERFKKVELKEKTLRTILPSHVENVLSKDLVLNNAVDSSYASPKLFTAMDGRTLQLFLNEHLNRHDLVRGAISTVFSVSSDPAKLVLDAMEGFYPPRSSDCDPEFDVDIVRRSCVLLLEHLSRFSPQIKPEVKEEAMKIAFEWKARMRVGDNSLEIVAFLQLLATYGLASAFNPNELQNLLDMITQHRLYPELRQAFGSANMVTASIIPCAQMKMEEPEDSLANNANISLSGVLQPSAPINSLLFLEELSDGHNLTSAEIFDALKATLDPALVFLNVMKRSCVQHWNDGLGNLKRSVMTRYILVLEQLIKASPPIMSSVKEEAMELAIKWKAKLTEGTDNSMEALVFLYLLAAYGLVSSFGGDEILKLFQIVARHREASELCRTLGFADNVNDFVQSLIERKQNLEAIAFIHAFQLEDKFSPILVLQKYLQNVTTVKEISRRGHKDLAIEEELAALRSAAKCISDYKLDSKLLCEIIEKRIMELEMEKEDRKTTAAAAPSTITSASKDYAQQEGSDIAASPQTKAQQQQPMGVENTTLSSSKDHSQQQSRTSVATPATTGKGKQQAVKRDSPSASISKYHGKKQRGKKQKKSVQRESPSVSTPQDHVGQQRGKKRRRMTANSRPHSTVWNSAIPRPHPSVIPKSVGTVPVQSHATRRGYC